MWKGNTASRQNARNLLGTENKGLIMIIIDQPLPIDTSSDTIFNSRKAGAQDSYQKTSHNNEEVNHYYISLSVHSCIPEILKCLSLIFLRFSIFITVRDSIILSHYCNFAQYLNTLANVHWIQSWFPKIRLTAELNHQLEQLKWINHCWGSESHPHTGKARWAYCTINTVC